MTLFVRFPQRRARIKHELEKSPTRFVVFHPFAKNANGWSTRQNIVPFVHTFPGPKPLRAKSEPLAPPQVATSAAARPRPQSGCGAAPGPSRRAQHAAQGGVQRAARGGLQNHVEAVGALDAGDGRSAGAEHAHRAAAPGFGQDTCPAETPSPRPLPAFPTAPARWPARRRAGSASSGGISAPATKLA
jgi:hypothetical protein